MEKIENKKFSGERALFDTHDVEIDNCTFFDGESPLKESSNLLITNSSFEWKYPLWYCNHISAKNCSWFDMARAGVWYSNNVSVKEKTNLDEVYEPYLLKIGFIDRTQKGRILTNKAKDYLKKRKKLFFLL